MLLCSWKVVYKVIPDEYDQIQEELKRMVDKEMCCFVVTTGGTGPAARDVTPEATEAVRGPAVSCIYTHIYIYEYCIKPG